jgi:CheY-like chemotaxis protein
MDRRRPRNPPVRPLVLLVEGDEDTRALYDLALSASGFDVVVADEPYAYARAWEIHPDVIVADLPTPDQNDLGFLHVLKRDARTRDIPVVVFPKPCLSDELVAGLRELFTRQRHVHA